MNPAPTGLFLFLTDVFRAEFRHINSYAVQRLVFIWEQGEFITFLPALFIEGRKRLYWTYMLKIVYRVVIKEGQEQAFKELAEATLIPQAIKTPGCARFSLFQNSANPREFIFFETWDSEQSVREYKQTLVRLLGKLRPNEEFPEEMNCLIAEDEDLA